LYKPLAGGDVKITVPWIQAKWRFHRIQFIVTFSTDCRL